MDANQENTPTHEENENLGTAVEQEALKHGWKPQEEYEGDPANWRTAETFMALKPFYERIENQSKQLKKYGETFKQVTKDVANLRQVEYDRAIKQLKTERKSAFEDGDMDKYHQLEEELDDLKDQKRQAVSAAMASGSYSDEPDPSQRQVLDDWMHKNTWYENDEDLRDWADARGVKLSQKGVPPDTVLSMLEKEVREKFPTKFSNPNRNKTSAVTDGDASGTSVKTDNLGMSDEEKKIMRTIVNSGVMTQDEYIKEYKKIRGN